MLYQECIKCPKIGVSCDGPNFVAMPAQELLAWCKERKAYLHLTNAQLAEMSNVPKGTIDRLFAGEHVDFRFETVRPVVRALVGGDWSGNPCADPTDSERVAYEDRIKHLEEEAKAREEKMRLLAEENSRLQEHIKTENNQHQEQLKYLRGESKRKNKAVTILAVVAGVALLYIIITLIIDRLDPSRGYWWLESLLHLPQGFGDQTKLFT